MLERRYTISADGVAIGHNDRLCTLPVELLGQRASNSLGPSGHNDDAARDVHTFPPVSTVPN